jgi:hypothetical protein
MPPHLCDVEQRVEIIILAVTEDDEMGRNLVATQQIQHTLAQHTLVGCSCQEVLLQASVEALHP